MAIVVPCRPDLTHYDMSLVLDETTYILEFRWSTREGSWYIDLKEQDETPITMGVKVVPNLPLGARHQDLRRPPGWFVARDTSGKGLPPGQRDLGDRVQLYYLTKADLLG